MNPNYAFQVRYFSLHSFGFFHLEPNSVRSSNVVLICVIKLKKHVTPVGIEPRPLIDL